MDPRDEGGEPACWAHFVDYGRPDIRSRDDLQRLVIDFYRDVAMDDLLGPIFAAAHVDWSVHILKLVDFWAWQLLGQPGYERNPLRAHEPAHAVTPFRDVHYQRWLELFESTVDGSFAGPMADAAKGRAQRMANALRRLLEGTSGDKDAAVEIPWARPASRSTM